MKKFSTYITESAAEKDRHLTHIEDAVLEGGVAGTRNAIQFLISLRDMFADDGKTLKEARGGLILRTKFDGAPALYAGINPENGKFFVGSKSIFAKNAKLNYTVDDIRRNHSGGLAEKLETALKYLPELGITDIIHGDFMYSRNELKSETIDGKKYITFRPNTITYAVPEGTTLSRQILSSRMGIVFHTTYHGSSMSTLQTHFDVNIGKLRPSKNVWYRENKFMDVTGRATLTKSENDRLSSILTQAGGLFRTIPASLLNQLATNETYRLPIMTYMNQKVRAGQHMGPNFVNEVMNFIADKYNKSITDAKRPDTKANRKREKDAIMRWFHQNRVGLKNIFELQNLFIDAKTMLIHKFNQVNDIGTFIHTPEGGYRVTTPEGYVAAWSSGGDAVKLVDRMEFSRTNFLATKNWGK
jgi:hypothetical protein